MRRRQTVKSPHINLQENSCVEANSSNAAATMVFGKTWMPANATVYSTGNVVKSLMSPSSVSGNTSEMLSDSHTMNHKGFNGTVRRINP